MLHKPDGVTPVAETVEALGELVHEGKARYVGLSNVDVDQIDEAAAAAQEHGRAARLCREPLQPDPSRSGRGRHPGLRAPRLRPAALLPARERPSDGEVPPRRGTCPPTRASSATRPCGRPSGGSPTKPSTPSRRSRPSRASAVSRCSTSRSAASPRCPRSAASSPGRRRRPRFGRTRERGQWQPSADDLSALRRSRVSAAGYQANATVKPPSTTITWPVTYVAVSARK